MPDCFFFIQDVKQSLDVTIRCTCTSVCAYCLCIIVHCVIAGCNVINFDKLVASTKYHSFYICDASDILICMTLLQPLIAMPIKLKTADA